MNIGLVNGFSSVTNGKGSLNGAQISSDSSKFQDLIKKLQDKNQNTANETLSSSQIQQDGRLNGEYSTGFQGTFKSEADKNSSAMGAARNQAPVHGQNQKIDRTSKLYEKSMELESYFVKEVLKSMRNTVQKASAGQNEFAGKMYEDMLYDEYATSMTKNAGFGLADQIYLSLIR